MKKKEDEVKSKMVVVRLSKSEYETLLSFRKKSNEKNTSTYLRKTALHEPVTIVYRNGSADEFIQQMIGLKKELNAIGHNINQAVHRLHTLDKIPEFRYWIRQYETVHQQFRYKTDEILTICNRIHQLWLQE